MYRPTHIAQLESATGSGAVNKELYADGSTVLEHKASSKSKQFKAASAAIKQQARLVDPNDEDALKRAIDEFAAKDHSQVSERVLARRARISNMWLSVATFFDDSVTEDNLFHYQVVKNNIERFLPLMVKIIKPQKGYTVIRSSTLAEAFHTFITLVLQYTFDPITSDRKGYALLTKEGFFLKLQNQLKSLIQEHKLERVARTKLYYGREHLQILISCMLDDTKASGPRRVVVIQSLSRILFTFYATCRPSTTGYTEKKLRDAGLYPKLKDVRIFRRAYMSYEMESDLQNYKAALRTVEANRQVITFHSVLKAHNALFDPTIWFLALFFLRGDFAKKYQTIEELCNDESAELLFDPEKKEQPLFLAVNIGGKGFINPPQPSTSAAATESLGYWCHQARLPRVGLTAFRRDAGNLYGQQLGLKIAKLIMNHHEGRDVFNSHYSRTTDNFELVNYRLGEIRGSKEGEAGEALEHDRKLHLFKSTAVEFMLRFQGTNSDVKATRNKSQAARTAEIMTSPELLEIDSNIQRLYQDFLDCFTKQATHYKKPNKQNLNRIFNSATGEKVLKKIIEFQHGMEARAKELKEMLYTLYAQREKVKRSLMRKGVRSDLQNNSKSYLTNPLTGTAEEREAAAATFSEIVPEIKEAVEDYLSKTAEKKKGPSKDCTYNDDFEPNVELTQEIIDLGRYEPLENPDCQFSGNLQEWCQALSLEIQVEHQIQEEEEEFEKDTAKLINLLKNVTNSSESSSKSSAEATVPGESDEDLLHAPDIDESVETDVLNLPVALVKRALLEKFVEPILRERGLMVTKDGKITYPCTICMQRGKSSLSKTVWFYERHMVDCHSPWKELELEMKSDNSTSFWCPARDGFVAKTVKKVFNHMITDKCSNWLEHMQMKDKHDECAAPFHKRLSSSPSESATIPHDNKVLKEFEENMEWLYVDEGFKIRGLAESPFDSHSEDVIKVDWEFLGLGRFNEADFNMFRFQELPENITLVDEDE